MKFKTTAYDKSLDNIKILYDSKDFSFDMEPRFFYQDFVITINYLQLGMNHNMIISNISGFCPYQAWKEIDIDVPNHEKASIRVEVDFDPLSGGGYKIKDEDWPQYVNRTTGWYCVGDPKKKEKAIEFIKNCVAILEDDQIVALWLYPVNYLDIPFP